MRISRRFVSVAWAVAAALAAGTAAYAFDGTTVGQETPMTVVVPQPVTALPIKKIVPIGPEQSALTTLQYQAESGQPFAQWKLGRMYAAGEGVARNDLRAFEYFSGVTNAHADDDVLTASQAAIVANAFLALGRYYRDGIPNTKVKANPERARQMFSNAAYFGNADAQYDLAQMYINGSGIVRDPRYGIRWLRLAAQKDQYHAQALLGEILSAGKQVPRQAAEGLMWLMVARDSASPDETWITDSYNNAMAKASVDDQTMAVQLLQNRVKGHRD